MSEDMNKRLEEIKNILRAINDNLCRLNRSVEEEDEYEYDLL